ncbi:MAG: protease pro-enzyme activation domain-containing protein [Candidatus Cybelea sp.]
MKKYVGLAAGILPASYGGNGTSPLPSSDNERIPPGCAATSTHALPASISGKLSGSVSGATPLRIVVRLIMREKAGAQQIVRSQYVQGSANFRKWLTPGPFTAMFNPTTSQAAGVADYLKQQGFTKVSVELNNLAISATGAVSRVEVAFHITIRGIMPNGKLVHGNVEAALVACQVPRTGAAILGIHNAH